jgi:hypothetical protein
LLPEPLGVAADERGIYVPYVEDRAGEGRAVVLAATTL